MISKPTADFVTSTLDGSFAVGATTAMIDSGLDLPLTNGILHIDFDTATPETIHYATYVPGTGALAGITRGMAGTTDASHATGASVSAGISIEHINQYDRKNTSGQTIIGKNDTRATRFVPVNAVRLVSTTDLTNTLWNDVDCTAYTSLRAYAVVCNVYMNGSTAGRVIRVRPRGSSGAGVPEYACTQLVALHWSTAGEFVTEVDNNQVFQYQGSNTDITNLYITLTGYFEYVD